MTKTVLVVDDSRVSRLMIKAIIESKFPEWSIAEASDGDTALRMARENDYDFISLDMNMSGRDGLMIAPDLMTECPNARIALLTGNLQERVKEQALKQGLVFISKPITEQKVLAFYESQT